MEDQLGILECFRYYPFQHANHSPLISAVPAWFLLSKIRNFKLGPKRLKLENLKQKRKQIEIGTRKEKVNL